MSALKTAAVIGWPIAHSLSPVLHNYWLREYGIAGHYEAAAITPENLAAMLPQLREQLVGFNVTVPHKETMLRLVDTVDATAQRIGAVNTVVVKNGKLYGSNTDAYGFAENLKQHQPRFNVENKSVVVLGAGGAARAVVYALLAMQVAQISIINRNRQRAQQLADDFTNDRLVVGDWEQRSDLLSNAALLVNTTVLGMTGQPPLDIDLSQMPADGIVYDIVYKPLLTPLLAAAQARGLQTVDGLGMLLHQAAPAFETFFGVRPQITDALRAHVWAHLS